MPPEVVPIARVDIRPEDIEAVAAVLASGNLRQGRVVAEFEEAFATRVGARHAVAVSSGTAALHLAYLALFRPGDEVIVPTFTFVATASMLLAVGAVPVFADVDPRTLTLSIDDARTKITEKTRGIVGVHLFGNACEVHELTKLAREHDLTLLWDAAQALGTEYDGRDVGSYPVASCYSFYPTKNITTGEGGMVTTDDDELGRLLRLQRSQGAADKYFHTVLGFNYRMTDVAAALGISQLARLNRYIQARRSHAAQLTDLLRHVRGLALPLETPGGCHSYNQYCVVLSNGSRRPEIQGFLRHRGIETAIHYPRPLHRQPLFLDGSVVCAQAEQICEGIMALPVHANLEPPALNRIASALQDSLEP